jgi:hypothetical protein
MDFASLVDLCNAHPDAFVAVAAMGACAKLYRDLRSSRAEVLRIAMINVPVAVKLAEGVSALDRLVAAQGR